MHFTKPLKNQSGGLAVDFIFAITITMASVAVFFAVTFSLSIVEVAQYIGFASARTYFAAHLDPETQSSRAELKFNQLVNTSVLKNLFKTSEWFKLSYVDSKDFSEDYTENRDPLGRDIFEGSRLKFEAEMLSFNFPLIGSAGEEAFSAEINNYLGREVSFKECQSLINERYNLLLGLGYNVTDGGGNSYIPLMDNGC